MRCVRGGWRGGKIGDGDEDEGTLGRWKWGLGCRERALTGRGTQRARHDDPGARQGARRYGLGDRGAGWDV